MLAGGHVTFFHVFGMIGSLVAPLIMRGTMQRMVPVLIPLVGVIGGIGVVFYPGFTDADSRLVISRVQ